jgi:hypothetical protein
MHINTGEALIVSAVVATVILVLDRGDRLWPVLAAVAAGVEALLVFKIISLSISSFNVGTVLAAILTVAAGVCWMRSSGKSTVTAATVALMVGLLQLLHALSILN